MRLFRGDKSNQRIYSPSQNHKYYFAHINIMHQIGDGRVVSVYISAVFVNRFWCTQPNCIKANAEHFSAVKQVISSSLVMLVAGFSIDLKFLVQNKCIRDLVFGLELYC